MTHEQKRKNKGSLALGLSTAAALIGLFWLVFILGDVLVNGIRALNPGLFLEDPAPPGVESGGGLRNAFIGQLMITFFATLIGVPIGILGGSFLAEYGRRTQFSWVISVLADIIVSVPSIVIGTFIYAALVRPVHHFSGRAGAIALSLIMIPVVLRTTEDMLSLVPWTLREGRLRPRGPLLLQGHHPGGLPGSGNGNSYGRPPFYCTGCRRNSSAPVHLVQQQFLFDEYERSGCVVDRHHFSIRHGPLRELAFAGMGRIVRDHALHPRPYPGRQARSEMEV